MDYVLRHKGTPFTLLQQVEKQLNEMVVSARDQPNSYLNPAIPKNEAEFLTRTLLPLLKQYLILAENNPDSQQLMGLIQQYTQIQPQPQSTPWRQNSKLHR